MEPILVFDIETIPDVSGLRRLESYDSDLSDSEVVLKAQSKLLEEKGSDFFPLYLQKIAAISCVIRRGSQHFEVCSLGTEDSDEQDIMTDFFGLIEDMRPRLVSWNGNGFDLPVLHYRSLIHGIPAARYWNTSGEAKYNNYLSRYHTQHIDLMDMLAKYNSRANAPLDQLAKLSGFPGKLGIDGSQVWNYFLEGKLSEIRAYCETDVTNTWLLFCRFLLIRAVLTKESYQKEINLVRQTLESYPEQHWQQYLEAWSNT